MGKHTLVLGASLNPARFSYAAVHALVEHGHPTSAVGLRSGEVHGVSIMVGQPQIKGIHTITLYMNPRNQVAYYDYILGLKPKRIIFNPGTENKELRTMAADKGIDVVDDCTLYMLSLGTF